MKRLIVKLVNLNILNNSLFNRFLHAFGWDSAFANYANVYNYKNDENPDGSKSLQEIAGYSERAEMTELLAFIHAKLNTIRTAYFPKGGKVLDIGCGPGLFLQDVSDKFSVEGIDITPGMIKLAKKNLPQAKFYCGDFITEDIDAKFDLIFSVGTLMYIDMSSIKKFKAKVNELLNQNGIVFLSYPHAISTKDLKYPNLFYVQYSPKFLESLFQDDFELIYHARAVDEKIISDFDENPFVHPVNSNYKTYKNSSILILQKK